MTLTIKKSRAITVEGSDYRYQVSTTKIDENCNFSLNLTIQKWNPPSSILKITGLVTRNYWLDLSDGEKWQLNSYPVLLPSHIASLIKSAKSVGWKPDTSKKPFTLNTNNGALFKT